MPLNGGTFLQNVIQKTRGLLESFHYHDTNMETFMTKTPDIQRGKHILSMVKASVNREMKTESIEYI